MIKCPISGKVCLKFKAYSVTNIKDEKVEVLGVCEDCLCFLDEKNILNKEKEKEVSEKIKSCSFCNLTFDELLKNSKLGCANCYDVFEKFLSIAFEKFQRTPDLTGELVHVGQVPTQWKKLQSRQTDPKKFILELKQKLALCIKDENFKKAKELKDYIFAFEKLYKKIDEFKNDQEQQSLIFDQIYEFIYGFREKESEK